jgi:hypothetical protein
MSAQIPIAVRAHTVFLDPHLMNHALRQAYKVRDRVSERAKKTLDVVAKFVEEDCIP